MNNSMLIDSVKQTRSGQQKTMSSYYQVGNKGQTKLDFNASQGVNKRKYDVELAAQLNWHINHPVVTEHSAEREKSSLTTINQNAAKYKKQRK